MDWVKIYNILPAADPVVAEFIPDNAIVCGAPCKIKKWNQLLKENKSLVHDVGSQKIKQTKG